MSLGVTLSPTDFNRRWQAQVGDTVPKACKLLTVGPDGVDHPKAPIGPVVSVETVPNAGDLTGMGVMLVEALDELTGDDTIILFCFHSLTPLLQYAPTDRVYRFVHVLTNHMTRANAVAHYHMDPRAHDERTVNTLVTLFDAVIEADADTVRIKGV